MNYSVDVEITAPVYETEVEERVAAAIRELFPNAEPESRNGELHATVHDLEHFSELLHRHEILDTARSVFFRNRRGDTFTFRLKKAAATQGVVNFELEDAGELGAIAVRVRVAEPDLESYLDYVAPPTVDGTPVEG
ncbi:MAG: RNA-binding domain-containing protein [Haloarculaceae archaeon]